MPKDAQWNMRWAKNIVECIKLHLAQRRHSNFYVQSLRCIFQCGASVQKHVQNGVIAHDQNALDTSCFNIKTTERKYFVA